jgi:outer membrane protein assembly factor BamB
MKKISLLILAFLISSCTGSGKIKALTELTDRLVSNSDTRVEVGQPIKINNFTNQINFFSSNDSSIYLDKINPKLGFRKVSLSSKLAAAPYIHENNLFILEQAGRVKCFDLESGKAKWEMNLGVYKSKISFGTLSFNNDKIFVTADMNLYVLNAENGREIYKTSLEDSVKSYPLLFANAIVIQDVSNILKAYNTDNWRLAWIYESWPEYISSNALHAPIIAGEQLITAFSSGQLVSLNITSGELLWQKNLSADLTDTMEYAPTNLATMPIVAGSNLFIASSTNKLIKISLRNSADIWSKKFENIISMSASGNALFITNNARQIAAVSSVDGSVIWATDLVNPSAKKDAKIIPATFTPPIVTPHGIYVFSSKGEGFLVDEEIGKIREYFKVPESIESVGLYQDKIILFDKKSAYIAR